MKKNRLLKKKFNAFLLISIIIVSIILGGLYYRFFVYNRFHFSYVVTVLPSTSDSYYVYVPVIVTEDGKLLNEFENNLEIVYGTGHYTIIETQFGFCLNISSNNPIKIKSEFKLDEILQLFVSTRNVTNNKYSLGYRGEYSVYSMFSNNNTLHLNIESQLKGKFVWQESHIEGNIQNIGWTAIKGEDGNVIT